MKEKLTENEKIKGQLKMLEEETMAQKLEIKQMGSKLGDFEL
jgi:hypothetical protein